jgi:hypothetical protein
MDKKELESKIKSVKSEISKLTAELSKLEKLYIESHDSFEEKFLAWYKSDSKKICLGSYPSASKYPMIRELGEERDPNRYETVYLLDCIEDYINCLENEEYMKEAIENGWITLSKLRFYRKVAKEMMENNVDSFICDW